MNTTNTDLDSRYIIEALLEENKAVNDNRLYLMAVIRQLKAEFEEAKQMWELERESLSKKGE